MAHVAGDFLDLDQVIIAGRVDYCNTFSTVVGFSTVRFGIDIRLAPCAPDNVYFLM